MASKVINFGDLEFPSSDGNEEIKFFLKFHCIKFSNRRTIRANKTAPRHGSIKLPMPPNMLTQTSTTYVRDQSVESGLAEAFKGTSRGLFGFLPLGGFGAGLSQLVEPTLSPFPRTMMDASEMLFQNTNQRLFQFNYQLVAKNYGEAREINEIAKVFEGFGLPKNSGNTFRADNPANWWWEAQDKSGAPLDAAAWLGSPTLTFLQNLSVDRTSSGGVYAISGDGGPPLPMSVSIGVQFIEMEPVMLDTDLSIQPRSKIIIGNLKGGEASAEGG